jgi:asparagine synthase (glutamine-hydrolysing)
MALSGLGGDEVFAGYDVFLRMKKLEQRKWLNAAPQTVRNMAASVLTRVRPSISSEKISAALRKEKIDFSHFYPVTRQLLMDDQVALLVKEKKSVVNIVETITHQIATSALPLFSKVSVAEMTTYMQNVLLRDTDQMSMAHSLEVRVPFLDHRLVEYVLGVNDEIKFPHTPKELLTKSIGDMLPREIIDRPKMGFTFPWAAWMKNELKPMCEENINALGAIESLDHGEVIKLWKGFLSGYKMVTCSRLWPLVVLGHWVKQHDVH